MTRPLPLPSAAPTEPARPRARRLIAAGRDWLAHLRRRWPLYLVLALIWAGAYARLFVAPRPWLPLLFNWTPSLPYRLAWMSAGPEKVKRGDCIVYAFDGPAAARFPGLKGQPFFKIVKGLPGDVVSVDGPAVAVNGEPVGVAKPRAYDQSPLTPIAPTIIPPGHYYVQGTSPDSFDSRYRESGLVRAGQVIGVVTPLF